MVPVSVVNSLRRQAVEQLLAARREVRREGLSAEEIQHILQTEGLQSGDVFCEAKASVSAMHERKRLVPLEWFMEESFDRSDAIPYVLNVSKGELDAYIDEHFHDIIQAVGTSGIALGNLGWIKAFQENGVNVYGDYGLNVFNGQAAKAFAENGVEMIALSDECSDDGKHVMMDKSLWREPKLMQRVPLMITEHPIQTDTLTDRKGVPHEVLKWFSGDKYLLF